MCVSVIDCNCRLVRLQIVPNCMVDELSRQLLEDTFSKPMFLDSVTIRNELNNVTVCNITVIVLQLLLVRI